jgi:hypothetical protein
VSSSSTHLSLYFFFVGASLFFWFGSVRDLIPHKLN